MSVLSDPITYLTFLLFAVPQMVINALLRRRVKKLEAGIKQLRSADMIWRPTIAGRYTFSVDTSEQP